MLWLILLFFLKQKTAYEMRISDWSSDVCSSDLRINCCVGIACLALACNPLLNICRQRSLAPVDIGLCRAARAGAIFTIGKMYVYLPDTLRHDSRAAPDHSRKIVKRHIPRALGIAPAHDHTQFTDCLKFRYPITPCGNHT